MSPEQELTLWVGATRYYLGRMSIAVGFFTEMLCGAWPVLFRGTRDAIRWDVEEAFERDDRGRVRRGRRFALGCDCDRASWNTVRALWCASVP